MVSKAHKPLQAIIAIQFLTVSTNAPLQYTIGQLEL